LNAKILKNNARRRDPVVAGAEIHVKKTLSEIVYNTPGKSHQSLQVFSAIYVTAGIVNRGVNAGVIIL